GQLVGGGLAGHAPLLGLEPRELVEVDPGRKPGLAGGRLVVAPPLATDRQRVIADDPGLGAVASIVVDHRDRFVGVVVPQAKVLPVAVAPREAEHLRWVLPKPAVHALVE